MLRDASEKVRTVRLQCQASPATQDGSPTSRRRSFYLFLMPDAFPSMPLTDAQAVVKAGEAVLAHYRVA